MPTFLEPVSIPQRCFLFEVLLWVAFQRLPVSNYDGGGNEIRETREIGGYAADATDAIIFEGECIRAGIPVDPRYVDLLECDSFSVEAFKDRELFLAYIKIVAGETAQQELKAKQARREQEYASWKPHYLKAVEYSASQIFVALREGRLRARGRQLPAAGYEEAMIELDQSGQDIFDLPVEDISPGFWTLQGMDFESSAARNDTAHYCHITLVTEEVLSAFPGPRERLVVERVGDTFVLDKAEKVPVGTRRGRPPYPWDQFHLEVATRLQRNELPSKKEAGIQEFQTWFANELGLHPSRAAIGEKLKPYYDRFLKRGGQKI